jgi:hypothetical protein
LIQINAPAGKTKIIQSGTIGLPAREAFMKRFVQRLRNRISQLRLRAELDRLSGGELQNLAQDVGVSVPCLRAVVQGNPDAAELLPRRMAALDLDPEELTRRMPEISRDLQRVCSSCESYGRCLRDLDSDTEGAVWAYYCPNAPTLQELQIMKVAAG